MKFGKVQDPTTVDFELPADYPSPPSLSCNEGGSVPIWVGATGWSMRPWLGKWYAPGTKTTEFLEAYGQLFNTIELNTTHYRIPEADLMRSWAERVPDDFRFCPKIPQRISHSRGLAVGSGLIKQTIDGLAAFDDKMGCAFIQLPPYFDASRLDELDRFLTAWPQLLPIAVEVRHESWFSSPASTDAWIECLIRHGAAAVITDVAGRRDVLHMALTAARTMIRWVGNGLIDSDYERLDQWVDRLGRWKCPETYIFPHEPDNLLAPEAAEFLVQRLQQTDWALTRGPVPYTESEPDQLSLF